MSATIDLDTSDFTGVRRATVVEVVDLPGMARAGRLSGADLGGTFLGRADLGGANADQYTRWPEGFNPATTGVS